MAVSITEFRAATSAILERMRFFRRAGVTFDGKRDMYAILGYQDILSYRDYRDRYERGGVAGRIVDSFPNATWRGEFELIEDEKRKSYTPFEQAWKDLDQEHQIQAKLCRVDKLSRLSTYAVLLIGAPGDLDTPLPKNEKLLFLQPFSGGGGPANNNRLSAASSFIGDADCTIETFDTDAHSKRFGLPLSYRIKRTDISSVDLARPVHWTRISHIAENVLDNEVYGLPALERVWNLLDDLAKVTGGGAEAFWLRANAGLHINVDKDTTFTPPKAGEQSELDKVKEQAELYEHQLTRMIRTRGMEINQLGSDVANFESPADSILTQIAGATSIPKRILTGSEMGELASSQDRDNWKDQVNGRQTGYAGPYIVRPLVSRLIEYGYLPAPAKGPLAYEVKWPHIQTLTEQEKVEGAKGWATVNQTQGMPVFTSDEIRDKWADREPLTEEQKAAHLADKQAANPIPPPVVPIDPKSGKPLATRLDQPPAKPNPFQKRAAEEDLNETLRALEEAIENDDLQAISKLLDLQYKYGSTQVQLPPDVAERLFAIGRDIPDSALAADGRETDAHITVKYGLLEPNASALAAIVGNVGPITFTLGQTAFFKAPGYDVVYVEVYSPVLASLNSAIELGVPCAPSDHGKYVPHATVAYVQSGLGAKFIGNTALENVVVTVDRITLTDAEGGRTEVSLDNTRVLGDLPGHEFHGNQYTGSYGVGKAMSHLHEIASGDDHHDSDRAALKQALSKLTKSQVEQAARSQANAWARGSEDDEDRQPKVADGAFKDIMSAYREVMR